MGEEVRFKLRSNGEVEAVDMLAEAGLNPGEASLNPFAFDTGDYTGLVIVGDVECCSSSYGQEHLRNAG